METILIIEDNDMVRENMAEILQLANYQVLTAQNGKVGVELALQQKPDVVICDIMMPGLDGYGVLHVFEKKPELETIPFIFLSAKTERADIRKGMEGGADDYLTKPFQESELLNAIEGRLRKARALKKDTSSPAGTGPEVMATSPYRTLEALTDGKKVYAYKKKQTLYLEGNEAYKVYYIRKGKVKIYRSSPDGKNFVTGIYIQGNFFGYLPLIEAIPYQEAAETLEDSEIVVIPKEEFLALLYQNSQVTRDLIRTLANNISEKEKQLSDLAYNSLRKRTADSLLYLQNKYQQADEGRPAIQVSREDIANLVGSSTESLIRTLSDFKNEQLIDIVDGKILILNEPKLKRLPN
jgi:CRP/FNR family transcriptional regulator, cyclic AMP receptor protein